MYTNEMNLEDAAKWRKLCELVNYDQAVVVFFNRVDTINTGLEVNDSGDLEDEIKISMQE